MTAADLDDASRAERDRNQQAMLIACAQARCASASDVTSLLRIGSVLTVPHDRIVMAEGDSADYVFSILSGTLRSTQLLPDGRRYIADFLMPGSLFGYADEGLYRRTVETVSKAMLVRYSRMHFDALVMENPQVEHRLLALMRTKLSIANDHMLLLSRKNAVERLATFLLEMAERLPERTKIIQFRLPMPRIDIADYLGLTTETVSRVFTQFEKCGFIELRSSRRIVLLRHNVLAALSEGMAVRLPQISAQL